MGSHMSSILCPRCREGFVGVQNPLTINPYGRGVKWQCDKCRRSIGGRLVRATLDITRTLIDNTDDSDIKVCPLSLSKILDLFVKFVNFTLFNNHFQGSRNIDNEAVTISAFESFFNVGLKAEIIGRIPKRDGITKSTKESYAKDVRHMQRDVQRVRSS